MFRFLVLFLFVLNLSAGWLSNTRPLVELRKEPLQYSLTSAVLSTEQEGVESVVFQVGQTLNYLTEFVAHPVARGVTVLLSSYLQFDLGVALLEVGVGRAMDMVGAKNITYKWAYADKPNTNKWAFLAGSPFASLRKFGAQAHAEFFYGTPLVNGVLASLDNQKTVNDVVKAGLDLIKDSPYDLCYFRAMSQFCWGGLNASQNSARYVVDQMLMGHSVRPETVIPVFMRKIVGALYEKGLKDDQVINHMSTVNLYYNIIDAPKGIDTYKKLCILSAVLSGSVVSGMYGLFTNQLMKPFWIANRILWPEFSAFLTKWGPSLLVETAVKINDNFFITGGVEFLACSSKNPLAEVDWTADALKKYSTYGSIAKKSFEARLGLGCKFGDFTILGHSLVTGLGGKIRAEYRIPNQPLAVEFGVSWSSIKTLSGERETESRLYSTNGGAEDGLTNDDIKKARTYGVWGGVQITV